MRYLCGAASGSKFVCKNCLIASESQDPASPASSAMQPSGVSSDGGPASLDSSAAIKIRRKYGRVFKLRVIEYAEKFSNREAGRKFCVDELSKKLAQEQE